MSEEGLCFCSLLLLFLFLMCHFSTTVLLLKSLMLMIALVFPLIRKRVRECINFRDEYGNVCLSDLVITEACNEHPCSSWTGWTEWTGCSVSCGGGGRRRRARECLEDSPWRRERLCPGEAEETDECGEEECPTLTGQHVILTLGSRELLLL